MTKYQFLLESQSYGCKNTGKNPLKQRKLEVHSQGIIHSDDIYAIYPLPASKLKQEIVMYAFIISNKHILKNNPNIKKDPTLFRI